MASAKLHATIFGAPAPLTGARANQLALELGQTAQHGQHQATKPASSITPREGDENS
jgi:hypothetical protein